jgi:Flp pilus assembly protein TadG
MKHRPLQQLMKDRSGSVLVLVALSLIILVTLVGSGYDLARQQLVRQKIQQSCDAAALAAASLPTSASSSDRQTEATLYFALNFPATYLGVPQPMVNVAVTSTDVTVSLPAPVNVPTSFISNIGITTLPATGLSNVGFSLTASSDYDVVMVVDESGSEGTPSPPYTNREEAQKAALTTMANSILPATPNPNVRMGFVGFSGYISNKWGLSSSNADAMSAITNFVPRDQNFDHVALLAARNMLLGGQGAANENINMPLGAVAINTTTPNPRTARTNAVDANGIAPTKYVVFLSDGGIMIEPSDTDAFGPPYFDLSGLVHSDCPGRTPFDMECFAAFNDACTQLRNTGGTDNVHVFIVNLETFVTSGELDSLTQCASPTIAGGPVYTAAVKPNAAKDFYYAADSATLASILTNITTTIQKERITQ